MKHRLRLLACCLALDTDVGHVEACVQEGSKYHVSWIVIEAIPTWWETLLELLGLLCVVDYERVEVAGASDLELGLCAAGLERLLDSC